MKIAIDGPSASGKSTVAKLISEKLVIPYLETGLVYRTFAYLSLAKKISLEKLDELFSEKIEVIPKVGKTVINIATGEIPEVELRTEEVGKRASQLGAIPEFRERINSFFRQIVGSNQIVVEGRDSGTHIIPEAEVKIFITASPEERARRRYKQLRSLGTEVSYEEILQKILERDRRDMERPLYPFRPAEDAIIVDTTGKEIEEVLKEILEIIYEHSKHSKST